MKIGFAGSFQMKKPVSRVRSRIGAKSSIFDIVNGF